MDVGTESPLDLTVLPRRYFRLGFFKSIDTICILWYYYYGESAGQAGL